MENKNKTFFFFLTILQASNTNATEIPFCRKAFDEQ